MAKNCHCKKPAECEECPEWIFTFADLVMLMMGFFVILWVLKPNPGQAATAKGGDPAAESTEGKSADKKRWLQTVGEIRKGFGYVPDPGSKDPVDVEMRRAAQQVTPPFKGPGQGGDTKEPKKGAVGSDPLVTIVRPGTHVGVGGRLGFDTGRAELTPETRRSLDEIAHFIGGQRRIIQVKGHTSLDDLPETATPQQRMDLSLRRAQVAADYLIAHGVLLDTVRVQGCSTFEPVVQRRYDREAQAANRRVEVEATDSLVTERQDANQPQAAPLLPTTRPTAGPSPTPVHTEE